MIKSNNEKWYHHEMVICGLIALGIFGIAFLLLKLGVSSDKIGIIIGCIFFGIILLPAIDPIKDAIKWVKKRRTNSQ